MKFNIGDRISYGGAMIGPEEKEAINRVIDSQGGRRWTIGPESVAFEQELASVTGVKRAVVVNSGSSALLLSLTAFHFPKGSKVIIPACNFPTAFNSIIQCNLTPIVVDSDIKTLNLDLEEVKKAILKYPEIAAVIAVNIAGNPVDLLKLREIVRVWDDYAWPYRRKNKYVFCREICRCIVCQFSCGAYYNYG
jgi:dTDP-4-amino-4,6-dideoxygalactose transaminase